MGVGTGSLSSLESLQRFKTSFPSSYIPPSGETRTQKHTEGSQGVGGKRVLSREGSVVVGPVE